MNRRSCDICNECAEQIRKHHECASIVADVHRATQYYGVNETVRRARSAIFREKTKEKIRPMTWVQKITGYQS